MSFEIAGLAIAFCVPITVAVLRMVPQRSKDNGYVKQETFDVKHDALNGSVCRIGKDVVAMRKDIGIEMKNMNTSINKLGIKVAEIGAAQK